jgi:hypothetical protein
MRVLVRVVYLRLGVNRHIHCLNSHVIYLRLTLNSIIRERGRYRDRDRDSLMRARDLATPKSKEPCTSTRIHTCSLHAQSGSYDVKVIRVLMHVQKMILTHGYVHTTFTCTRISDTNVYAEFEYMNKSWRHSRYCV